MLHAVVFKAAIIVSTYSLLVDSWILRVYVMTLAMY
jgi:hypothetical protein